MPATNKNNITSYEVRSTDTFLENFSILERLVADSALRQSFKSVTEILFKLFYKINKFCSTCPIVTIIFLVFYSYDFIRGMHGINFVEITLLRLLRYMHIYHVIFIPNFSY